MTFRLLLSRLALLHHVSPPALTEIEHRRAVLGGLPQRYRITQQAKARSLQHWAEMYDSRKQKAS